MKLNGHQNLPPSIPGWAKERVAKLLSEGERIEASSAQVPDGFVKRSLSEEQAVLGQWDNRRSFARMHHIDNNAELNRDLDPAPNKVDLGWSQFEFNGDYQNGYVLQTIEGEAANLTLHNGSVTTNVDLRANGAAAYRRMDARHPERSIAFETQHTKDARTTEITSEHFQATNAATALIAGRRATTLKEKAAQLFLHPEDNPAQIRRELLQDLRKGVKKLPAGQRASLQELLEAPNAKTPRRLHRQLLDLAEANPEQKELQSLRELSGSWQVLEDAPKLISDGIVRNQEFYLAPGTLQMRAAAQGWEFDKQTNLPIADTVIVGGGPGGLATGYHLSEQGQRTILFEGGKIGQAFSDASAQSVHQLRTTSVSSDLIYTNSRTDLGIDVSLRRQAEGIFDKGKAARESWSSFRGETNHSGNEGFGALNRNNIFEHMVQIGHGLATKYPHTMVSENSPIETIKVEKRGEDTLFRVKSELGHEVLTRSLVMATGFVGSSGEYARGLKQFSSLEESHPNSVTVLGNDHDIVAKNDKLLEKGQSLVFSERLLGRREVRERIKALPEGSRLAVVGGGESAAKGTIEALNLNPGLKVDLYTKSPLEPYQVQIPVSHFGRTVTENAIKNKELADETLHEFEQLKTPITTETMTTLLSFEAEGRLGIREMGKHFDDRTVGVEYNNSAFQLTLKDREVAENLKAQRSSWTESGLYGSDPPEQPADLLQPADMVMVAVGYDTSRVNASPLMQQLIDQGQVELKEGRVQYGEDGLTSSLNPNIGFNTASAVRMSADTALPGRAVRGLRLAQNLGNKLPTRERPSEAESIAKGLELGAADTKNPEEFPVPDLEFARSLLSFKTNGFRPDTLEFDIDIANSTPALEDQTWNHRHRELNIQFAGPNSTVRALVGRYQEHPETLTAAEKLTAQRALEMVRRLEQLEAQS